MSKSYGSFNFQTDAVLTNGTLTISGSFQSVSHGQKALNKEIIQDSVGVVQGLNYTGFYEEASFTYYIPTGVSLPTVAGEKWTITSTKNPAIAHTAWFIDDVEDKVTNKASLEVTLKMTFYPGGALAS